MELYQGHEVCKVATNGGEGKSERKKTMISLGFFGEKISSKVFLLVVAVC